MRINSLFEKYKTAPIQVRASFWFLICSFLQKGISVITTPIFTRIMTPAEYGQFGVFNSWFGIVVIIVSLSLYLGVHIQGLVKFSEGRDVFTSSLLGLTTVFLALWTAVYIVFHQFWNHVFMLTTVQMLAMLVMVWTTAVFNFWANEQRVRYSYRLLVAVTLIVSAARPILEIVLILNSDDKVTARILGIVLVELVGYSWMYFYQMKRGRKFFSKQFWKYALAFNIPLIPHYLSQVILNSADRIMIQSMVGSNEAGIYNLAYSLAMIMTIFNIALMQTLNPWMYQKIKERKDQDMAPIAYGTLIFIAVINLLLIILAPEVVAFFAPKSYYEAIWIVPPVAVGMYFMYSYDLFAKHAFYYEKTTFIMIATVLCAASNIVLNYFAINWFGYIAAGYTTLICYMMYSITHYLFMRKVCDEYCEGEYPYSTTKIVVITIPFMVIGLAFLAVYNHPIIRYSIVAASLIAMLIFRKRIIGFLKQVMDMRSSADQ